MFVRTEADISEANREAIRWPRINRTSRVERRSSRRRPSVRNERRRIGGLRQVRQKSLGALTLRFRNALKKGVEGIIEAGCVLIEAKKKLPRGHFTGWVVRELRFGSRKDGSREADLRKAEMLMLLARNEVIANPCHWHALPPSIRTLYELTQICSTQRLLKLIEKGKVHAGTTREEAIAFQPKSKRSSKLELKLPEQIATLVDVCIQLGQADCVLAHIRRRKRARDNLTVQMFEKVVRWVKPQLAKRTGGE
jgi:hypothetical protein